MSATNVTLIMSPREGFSDTPRVIESLYRDAGAPFELICVDGGSPAYIKNRLRAESERRGFKLIRTPYYLHENEARNRGLGDMESIETPYVVFIDNDVVGNPGWLKTLIDCADETGAAVVSPLLCLGEPLHSVIHVAGGSAAITIENGRRIFHEVHRFSERPVAEVRDQLKREPTQIAEFHCLLVRTDWLKKLGYFDENLTTTAEHNDFSMKIMEQGGVIMLEPAAVITQLFGRAIRWDELAYFFFRWDQKSSIASEKYFHAKWNAIPGEDMVSSFIWWRRRHALPRVQKALKFLFGWHISEWMFERIAGTLVWLAERRRLHLAPRSGMPMMQAPPEEQRAA